MYSDQSCDTVFILEILIYHFSLNFSAIPSIMESEFLPRLAMDFSDIPAPTIILGSLVVTIFWGFVAHVATKYWIARYPRSVAGLTYSVMSAEEFKKSVDGDSKLISRLQEAGIDWEPNAKTSNGMLNIVFKGPKDTDCLWIAKEITGNGQEYFELIPITMGPWRRQWLYFEVFFGYLVSYTLVTAVTS